MRFEENISKILRVSFILRHPLLSRRTFNDFTKKFVKAIVNYFKKQTVP